MPNPSLNTSIATTIAPWLSVRKSARALEFYKSAFGATEVFRIGEANADGGGIVARLSVDGAEFWLGDESPEHHNFSPPSLGGGTVRMVLTVADPDAVFARALAAGASQVVPVAEQHGWRVGRVVDPFGHHWEIGRQVEG
jgi:PhnB protein